MQPAGNSSAQQRILAAVMAAALACGAEGASALKADDSTLVEGAKLCTRYLPRHERQYGIPEHLLAAIASTESGRFHRALGLNLPWPWTINVQGAGYFFDSKEEAIQAVRSWQARGVSSIDVGCMQVNLQHHPNAFATLEQAFDPAYNVAYAAQFLKANFQEEGSWRKATADYHSRTFVYGEQYAGLVYGAWSRIINKVAEARAGKPILAASASKPSYTYAAIAGKPHGYHSLRMHSIALGHDTTRENGVIVVRPEYAGHSNIVADASSDTGFVTQMPARDAVAPERSAARPEGIKVASNTTDTAGHNAQIVRVHSDGSVRSKGQFEPSHVVRASSPSDSAGGALGATNGMFIFNN